jgi:hypothetical protein
MELSRSGLSGMRAPPGASDGVCFASARLDKALRLFSLTSLVRLSRARGSSFAQGASVCEVVRRMDVVPSLIYRWRQELRTAAAGFTEVVVAPGPEERAVTGQALEIELGRDIRV